MQTQILKYSWVVTLLFLAGAAVLAARLTSVFVAKNLWVSDVEVSASESRGAEPATQDRLSDYRIVQERNVFNANPKPPTAAPARKAPPPVAKPAPPPIVPLNITVLGTAVRDGGRSFALLESGGDLKLVREGDEVAPAALLAQVLHDRIRVDQGGTLQEFFLYPPEGETPEPRRRGSAVSRRKRPPAPPAGGSGTVRQVDEGKWAIDSREVEEATANMSKLMTQIRVVPNFTDGQPDGFKVFAIRPGSLFAKIGLQNGDVIKRVNGVEIQGPEQAFEAYQRLKDETSIQIDLTRRNQNQTFTYEIQ